MRLRHKYERPTDARPREVVKAAADVIRAYLSEPCLAGRPGMEERLQNALVVLESATRDHVKAHVLGRFILPLITQRVIADEILQRIAERVDDMERKRGRRP